MLLQLQLQPLLQLMLLQLLLQQQLQPQLIQLLLLLLQPNLTRFSLVETIEWPFQETERALLFFVTMLTELLIRPNGL